MVTNRSTRPRFEEELKAEILAAASVDRVEFGKPLPPLTRYDAVVYWPSLKNLVGVDALPWEGFQGLRVLFDTDAFQDYGGWWGSSYVGEWTRVLRRLSFDLIVVTGKRSLAHFLDGGFDADVVHKGYSPERFRDLGLGRRGLAHYGTAYLARRSMLRRLDNAGIPVTQIRAGYLELNEQLNSSLSALVCNMPGKLILPGRLGKIHQRVAPGALIRTGEAPEPMAKNFESSGAGCAVFMDYADDLEGLGFKDGETAIIYRDFDELVDKLRYWQPRPSELRRIGVAASDLCRSRHTFSQRAEDFIGVLDRRLRS